MKRKQNKTARISGQNPEFSDCHLAGPEQVVLIFFLINYKSCTADIKYKF